MTPLEAMKQALEALEEIKSDTFHPAKVFKHNPAIANLRAAIEQMDKAEPVAIIHDDGFWTHKPGKDPLDQFSGRRRLEVYAHPAPIPEGWKLVPVEPTSSMMVAGMSAIANAPDLHGIVSPNTGESFDCYAAMLAAAPEYKEGK